MDIFKFCQTLFLFLLNVVGCNIFISDNFTISSDKFRILNCNQTFFRFYRTFFRIFFKILVTRVFFRIILGYFGTNFGFQTLTIFGFYQTFFRFFFWRFLDATFLFQTNFKTQTLTRPFRILTDFFPFALESF